MFRLPLFVLLYAVAVAAVAAPTASWLIEPVSDQFIPEVLPPAWRGSAFTTLRLSMTPGEHRGASFLVVAGAGLQGVLPEPSALVADDGRQIAAVQTDIRIVKRWNQAGRADGSRQDNSLEPLLVPELLLKDDSLVKVDGKKNYLKLTSGEFMDISEPGMSRQRGIISVEQMPVRDAAVLQPVTIEPGYNRQYWVTLSVPEGTAPGWYRGSIAVNAGDDKLATLTIDLEVLPFELAPSMLVYSIFHRAIIDDRKPEGSVSSELRSNSQYSAELENMVAHGVTQPNLYQSYSSPEFERTLQLRQAAGVDQQELFLIGLPAVPTSSGQAPPGFASRVRDTRKKVGKYGVEELYVWGRDEAKGERLVEQKQVWEAARAAGAKVFVSGYQTNEAGGPGNFDLMGPMHDTFVAINPVTREESARWHSIGKRIFSYQNPTGGMERPLTYRQTHGLFLWQMNYDGVMPYAYADSFGNGWNDFDHATYRDHNFVYPTVDGVIDTLQWEGFREGITDVRYLSTVYAGLEQSDNAALVAEISAWLAQLKEQPLARIDFDAVREECAGYILALRASAVADDASDAAEAADAVAEPANPVELTEVLQFVSGDAGATYAEFATSARTAVVLRYGTSAEVADGVVASSALLYRHRLALPAMAPDKPLFVQLVTPGGAFDVVELRSGAGLSAQASRGTEGANDILTIDVSSPSLAQTLVDVDSSLLGWWRFSEAAGDDAFSVVGDAPPLELSGDARWAPGYIGGGLALDGSGDFAYSGGFDTTAGEPVTIEVWIKFNQFALERGARQDVFTGLYQHPINNHFYLNGKSALFEVSSLLKLGVWQHIVLTHTGDTSSAIVYVDGQAVPITDQKAPEAIDPLNGFAVGRSSGFFGGLLSGGTTQLDGAVDEVRVWGRVLSEPEVQAAFGQSSGRYRLVYPTAKTGSRSYKVTTIDMQGVTAEQTIPPSLTP